MTPLLDREYPGARFNIYDVSIIKFTFLPEKHCIAWTDSVTPHNDAAAGPHAGSGGLPGEMHNVAND